VRDALDRKGLVQRNGHVQGHARRAAQMLAEKAGHVATARGVGGTAEASVQDDRRCLGCLHGPSMPLLTASAVPALDASKITELDGHFGRFALAGGRKSTSQ